MLSITLVDHYDSFTHNLIAWLEGGQPFPRVRLVAFDDAVGMAAALERSEALVFSPGPKSPREASGSAHLMRQKLGYVPILGVCLGHQILADIAGLSIVRSQSPRHGACRTLAWASDSFLFAGMREPAVMAAYNSLVAAEGELAPGWHISARCEVGEIQALEYRVVDAALACGVQFHPESFLSQGAARLRRNWLTYVAAWAGEAASSRKPLAHP